MARRGQGQTKPSNEELIGKLREKIDEVRTENESKYGEITDLKKTMETLNSKIDTISEKLVIDHENKFTEIRQHLDEMCNNLQFKIEENNSFFLEKIQNGEKTIEASKSGQEMEIGQIRESLISDMNASKEEMTSDISSMKADFEFLSNRVDEVSEKFHEFEQNKKNNLIFYGVPSEARETPNQLVVKVRYNVMVN